MVLQGDRLDGVVETGRRLGAQLVGKRFEELELLGRIVFPGEQKTVFGKRQGLFPVSAKRQKGSEEIPYVDCQHGISIDLDFPMKPLQESDSSLDKSVLFDFYGVQEPLARSHP